MPNPLALKQVSREMSARLWEVVYNELSRHREFPIGASWAFLRSPWFDILLDWHIQVKHGFADEFNNHADNLIKLAKNQVTSQNYIEVFDFLQFVVRHRLCQNKFINDIAKALVVSRSAYRLIDETIVPVATPEEATTIKTAFSDLASTKFNGAKAHLREAATELNKGNFADSIRHSIHAVESVARKLDANSNTLAPALAALAKKERIHPALSIGFSKLYNYTSDEQGVRHALLDGAAASVDEADAVYMFGACAAFVSYLIRKGSIDIAVM